MSTYRKILIAIYTSFILTGNAWSIDKNITSDNAPEDPCLEASYGRLNLDLVEYRNPSYNSYLFSCAISVVVPYVKESRKSIIMRNKKRLKLANTLLNKKLDIKYNDQYASTLLMAVVDSYMPKDWKLKAVKLLISKGSDIQAKNIYGYTALDSAKFVKNTEIFKILSAYSK